MWFSITALCTAYWGNFLEMWYKELCQVFFLPMHLEWMPGQENPVWCRSSGSLSDVVLMVPCLMSFFWLPDCLPSDHYLSKYETRLCGWMHVRLMIIMLGSVLNYLILSICSCCLLLVSGLSGGECFTNETLFHPAFLWRYYYVLYVLYCQLAMQHQHEQSIREWAESEQRRREQAEQERQNEKLEQIKHKKKTEESMNALSLNLIYLLLVIYLALADLVTCQKGQVSSIH